MGSWQTLLNSLPGRCAHIASDWHHENSFGASTDRPGRGSPELRSTPPYGFGDVGRRSHGRRRAGTTRMGERVHQRHHARRAQPAKGPDSDAEGRPACTIAARIKCGTDGLAPPAGRRADHLCQPAVGIQGCGDDALGVRAPTAGRVVAPARRSARRHGLRRHHGPSATKSM